MVISTQVSVVHVKIRILLFPQKKMNMTENSSTTNQVITHNIKQPCFALWDPGDDCDGRILFVGNRLATFGVDINFESPLYFPEHAKVLAICGFVHSSDSMMSAHCVFDATNSLDTDKVKTAMGEFTYYGYHNSKNHFLGQKIERHQDTKHDCNLQFREQLDYFVEEIGEPERLLQAFNNLYWYHMLRRIYFEREETFRLSSFRSKLTVIVKDSKKPDFNHYLLKNSYLQNIHCFVPPNISIDVFLLPLSVNFLGNPIKLRRTHEFTDVVNKKGEIDINQMSRTENLIDLKIKEVSGMHREVTNKNTSYMCNICKCRLNAQVLLTNSDEPLCVNFVQIKNLFYRGKTFKRLLSILRNGHLLHDIFVGLLAYDLYVTKLKIDNYTPIDVLDFFFSREGTMVSSKYWSFCPGVMASNSKERRFLASCTTFNAMDSLTSNDLVLFAIGNNEFAKLVVEALGFLKKKDPINFFWGENGVICDQIDRIKAFRNILMPKLLTKVRDTQIFPNVMSSIQSQPWKTLENLKNFVNDKEGIHK